MGTRTRFCGVAGALLLALWVGACSSGGAAGTDTIDPVDAGTSSGDAIAVTDAGGVPLADVGGGNTDLGGGGADVGEDTWMPVDLGPLPDTGDDLVLLPQPLHAECRLWEGMVGGSIAVTLRLRTTRPATCVLWRVLADGQTFEQWADEVTPATDHEFLTSIHYMDGGENGPQPGLLMRWEVRCTDAESAVEVTSERWEYTLDADDVDCIWPYDEQCSDGSILMCRMGLPQCPIGRVPAVQNQCHRCVYPETCSCDDGTTLQCASPAPECPPTTEPAIQDGCHVCVDGFTCQVRSPIDCPDFVGARADCPFQYFEPSWEPDLCRGARCLDEPCRTDADCATENGHEGALRCVAGNCVDCWQDSQCLEGQLCRTGRCVDGAPSDCPAAPECGGEGCRLLSTSEVPCPVCVCDSQWSIPCAADDGCRVLSHYPYAACVNGRCAGCRTDDDCATGACVPPGQCLELSTHPSALYGTWLLGWLTALSHVSYVRFEPDGTLRRGNYIPDVASADDFPPVPCYRDGSIPPTLLGSWEALADSSGDLVVRLSLNLPGCGSQIDGWSGRFRVTLHDDGARATFVELEGDPPFEFEGYAVPPTSCLSDLSFCEPTSI